MAVVGHLERKVPGRERRGAALDPRVREEGAPGDDSKRPKRQQSVSRARKSVPETTTSCGERAARALGSADTTPGSGSNTVCRPDDVKCEPERL